MNYFPSYIGKIMKSSCKPITRLLLACKEGDIKEVKRLIEEGADVNGTSYPPWCKYSDPYSPIDTASHYGHLDIVKYLVGIGADVSSDRNYPLRVAIKHGYTDMVKYLVSEGCDISVLDSWGITMPFAEGDFEMVKLLVEYGVDLMIDNGHPFRLACKNNRFEVVKYLIETGLKVTSNANEVYQSVLSLGRMKIANYLTDLVLNEEKKHTLLRLLNRKKVINKDMLSLITLKILECIEYRYCFKDCYIK